jgi:hypothetical protein
MSLLAASLYGSSDAFSALGKALLFLLVPLAFPS